MKTFSDQLKVAIVHDWLVKLAGAERVLEQILRMFPKADVYTVVAYPEPDLAAILAGRNVSTTFIQKLPRARTHYQTYLPLMPLAIEQLDLSSYDVVISSSYAVAKGVLTGPGQVHISYVHSPIRYAWDLQHEYLRESGLAKGVKSWLARLILHRIRIWDCRTANGVDVWIANSKFIARRIQKVYGKQAEVIYPPVDVERFSFSDQKEDYFLTVSRLVPYKRIPLIVEAFRRMPEERLVVIGDGPDMRRLKETCPANVDLRGYESEPTVVAYTARAKAFVFAALEDFGIVPVEAQACGTPVIAYGKGGAAESVIDGETGLFFCAQTVDEIVSAVRRFNEAGSALSAAAARRNAERFSPYRFREEFMQAVTSGLERFGISPHQ